MAIPPWDSSLAFAGIPVAAGKNLSSGETNSAPPSEQVGAVATSTLSAAASGEIDSARPSGPPVSAVAEAVAEAEPTSLSAPRNTMGELGRNRSKFYRLLESDEVCQKIFEQFQVTHIRHNGYPEIVKLVDEKLGFNMSPRSWGELFSSGRALLQGKEPVGSLLIINVARKIIEKKGVTGPVKLVPATMREILEHSKEAMKALKQGTLFGKQALEIINEVTAILEAEGLLPIKYKQLERLISILRVVLSNPSLAKEKYSDSNRYMLVVAEQIAQADTSTAPKRPREASSFSATTPERPDSVAIRKATGVLGRTEAPRLNAAGAGAGIQGVSMPPPAPLTATRTVKKRVPKMYRVLESDELCRKIFEAFQVSWVSSKLMSEITSLAVTTLNLSLSRTHLCNLFKAGRDHLQGKESVARPSLINVARKIIEKAGVKGPVKIVPTTLKEIFEHSKEARKTVKHGIQVGWTQQAITEAVVTTLAAEDFPPQKYAGLDKYIRAVKDLLEHPDEARKKYVGQKANLLKIAEQIARADTSTAPKRPKEASSFSATTPERPDSVAIGEAAGVSERREAPRVHTAGVDAELFNDGYLLAELLREEGLASPAGAGGENGHSYVGGEEAEEAPLSPFFLAQPFGSRRTQVTGGVTPATVSGRGAGALEERMTEMYGPPAPKRPRVASSLSATTPEHPDSVAIGEAAGVLERREASRMHAAGAHSDLFWHIDPSAELFGADDEDLLASSLGNVDPALSASVSFEEDSPSAGQEENEMSGKGG